MDLINNPTLCHSGSWCVQTTFDPVAPVGATDMTTPSWSGQRTVYVQYWIKWAPDYVFNGFGKLISFGGQTAGLDVYLGWTALSPTAATLGIHGVPGTGVGGVITPNLSSMYVTVGQWYQIEAQATLISGTGACDGSFDVWINGTHTLSQTGYCNVDWPGKITAIQVSGDYNGTPGVSGIHTWIDNFVAADGYIP